MPLTPFLSSLPQRLRLTTSKVKFAEPPPTSQPLRAVKKKKAKKAKRSQKVAPDPGKTPKKPQRQNVRRPKPNPMKKASR